MIASPSSGVMTKRSASKSRLNPRAAVTPAPAGRADRRSALATLLLLGILLILALRLTMTETFRAPLSERLRAAQDTPEFLIKPTVPGSTLTVGLAIGVLLLSGLALLVTPAPGRAWRCLAMIAGLLVLAVASTCRAAAPFPALLGTCDLALALLAGWAVSILARSVERKQLIFCILFAIALAWSAKGFYWRFVELPDTIHYYEENKARIWAEQGWTATSKAKSLYESRMFSREVPGFLTFSNNFAEALIPLAMVVLGLVALGVRHLVREIPSAAPPLPVRGHSAPVKSRAAGPPQDAAGERPAFAVLVGATVLLLLALVVVLLLTASKGANAALAICALLFLAGIAWPSFIVRYRTAILRSAVVAMLVGAAAVVGYGLIRHGLPSRSLLFRWHYWTAAVRIIHDDAHAILGVGLNNFGDYYTQFKVPYSPEDVKDPHSIFVRFASELGLPAAGLVAVLIASYFRRAFAGPAPPAAAGEPPRRRSLAGTALVGLAFCTVWWTIRAAVAEPPVDWATRAWLTVFDIFYGMLAFIGLLLAAAQFQILRAAAAIRVLCLAVALGAAGMLLYDQVNMALVTGPVAMFFWVLLGACEPPETESDVLAAPPARAARVTGGMMIAAAAVLVVLLWVPVAEHSLPWDNTLREGRVRELLARNEPTRALAELDDAIAHDRRSVALLRWKVDIEAAAHRSTRDALRRIIELDPTDAVLLKTLAEMASDLPIPERIAALEHALWLDDQSRAAGEKPVLTESQRADVRQLIDNLQRLETTTSAATAR